MVCGKIASANQGTSNVFIINPEDLDKIINYILETDKKKSSKKPYMLSDV